MLDTDFTYHSTAPATMSVNKYITVGVPGNPGVYNSGLALGWNSSYNLLGYPDAYDIPDWNSNLPYGYKHPLLTSTSGSPPGTPPPGSGTLIPSSGQLFPLGLAS